MEDILRQRSIYTVACPLLAVFSQIYSKNWWQKAEQKDLENLPLGQKRSILKVLSRRVPLIGQNPCTRTIGKNIEGSIGLNR
jgi:hypothetical protein